MATKGSKKELSVRQENFVADLYNGVRSKSSGAAVTDEGDVRAPHLGLLIECKGQFGELTGNKPVRSTLLKQFEKAADEAWSVGMEPALALRFHAPDSVLADNDGWVDLIVHAIAGDAFRLTTLAEADAR